MTTLPYPGRHESFSSWDFRCKQWENERARRNQELNARRTNWGGYNYRPVVVGGEYRLPDGPTVKVEKTFPSRSKLAAAMRFAHRAHAILVEVELGNPNLITSRQDYLVIKPENMVALPQGVRIFEFACTETSWKDRARARVYDNDNH